MPLTFEVFRAASGKRVVSSLTLSLFKSVIGLAFSLEFFSLYTFLSVLYFRSLLNVIDFIQHKRLFSPFIQVYGNEFFSHKLISN